MNIPNPRQNDDPDLVRWGLAAFALVAGAFLMVYYVQLLQDSVARGAQWRFSHASGALSTAAESPVPDRVVLVSPQR